MPGEVERCLLVSAVGSAVTVWDASLNSPRWAVHLDSAVRCVRWNHTNQVVGAAGDDGLLSLHHHSSGHTVGRIPDPQHGEEGGDSSPHRAPGNIHSVAFSKGSRYMVSGGSPASEVLIWDLKRKVKVKSLLGHTDSVAAVAYSNGDQHIASGGASGTVLLHAQLSGTCVGELKFPALTGSISGLTFSSNDAAKHLLGASTSNGSVLVWDSGTRKIRSQFMAAHTSAASAVAFSASCDKSVFSSGLDKAVLWFDLLSQRAAHRLMVESPVTSLALKGDGVTVAAGTASGKIHIYDLRRISDDPTNAATPVVTLGAFGPSAVSSMHWQAFPSMQPLPLSMGGKVSNAGPDSLESFALPTGHPAEASYRESTPSPTSSKLFASADISLFSPLVDVKPLTPAVGGLPGGKPQAVSKSSLIPTSAQTLVHPSDFTKQAPAASAPSVASSDYDAAPSRFKLPETETKFSESASPTRATSTSQAESFDGSVFATHHNAAFSPTLKRSDSARSRKDVERPYAADATPSEWEDALGTSAGPAPAPAPRHGGVPAMPNRRASAPGSRLSLGVFQGNGTDDGQGPSLGGSAHASSAAANAMSPFMMQLFQRALDDSQAALKASMHEEIQNLHLELLRQFTMQQQEMAEMIENVTARQDQVMEEVLAIKRLHQQQYHQLR